MPLPLLALPIAMGVASAGGAIGQASAAKQQAKAMMPDEYQRRLKQLEQQQARGGLGLTDDERGMMEAQGLASRAGLVAQQQAQQLQRASAASGSALSGRDLFAQEMGMQDTLARAQTQEAAEIGRADRQAADAQRQQMMELQQRQADSEAARKMANRQLVGDLLGAAAGTAGNIYGAQQMTKGIDQMIGAAAGSQQSRNAQANIFKAQMAMSMAGAFGGGGSGGTGFAPPLPSLTFPGNAPTSGGQKFTGPDGTEYIYIDGKLVPVGA